MIGYLIWSRRSVVCSVHEHSDHAADAVTRAEELIFLRDGFSWPVAILPPVALLARGAWLALAAYVALAVLAVSVLGAIGADPAWGALALAVLGIVFGFEAAEIQRWSLDHSGWDEVGVVSGADQEECERRFFDSWFPAQTPPSSIKALDDTGQPSLLRRLFASRP